MTYAYATALGTIGAGLLLASLGCTPRPVAIYRIQNSELPPAAKSLVSPDARVTQVRQAVYAKGEIDYWIDYVTAEGSAKQIKYADYHQSQPTYVFERFDVPELR